MLPTFLAFSIRHGTLPFVYVYSPKTPQKIGHGKWHVPSATQILKPAPLGCGFQSVPSPTGEALRRVSRSATGGGAGEAPGSRAGGRPMGHRIGTTDDLQDADGV